MRKSLTRIICLGVMLIMGLGIMCACNKDDGNNQPISYTLGNCTINYFDKNDENYSCIVKSEYELNRFLRDKECAISKIYDNEFFSDKCLVLYFYKANIYNELNLTLTKNGGKLQIERKFSYPNDTAEDALRNWAFVLEVDKNDLGSITEVETI